ncbi:Sapep family Mn(2+)-dependent dipeptidase [Marinitoga litoralis]|uniref:Sapep family Mn(2+)-dependent dipeptidase n=1 Tax=Marinitoga litoralis TaxID=570855 RepID=UPI00196197C5|nr:Sapep family Mn(2+)-dependent dipeptidase [Marinitoga litoralis]MBM7559663.1 putative dipeptidase [Marinitoga litoralis]
MIEKLDDLIINKKSEFFHDLKEIIDIPSVNSESGEYPFGENIDKVLKKTLSICEKLGFKTYYNKYYGYAEIGEGEELVGVLGHLDVVPAGNLGDWETEPFNMIIKDGYVYGRGVQDDKGPLLASIYAIKLLDEIGYKFKKRIRVIFGTDEELLWRGIEKYKENEEIPKISFTPDSKFPLVYAEKGLLQLKIYSEEQSHLKLIGGNALNSVPDEIEIDNNDKLKDEMDKLGYEYLIRNGKIVVLGKSAHAKDTEKGINAIERILIALKNIGQTSNLINFVVNEIGEDPYARKIFDECKDEDSGYLKFNIGKINIDSNYQEIGVDIRIPVTIKKEFVLEKLREKTNKYNLKIEEIDWLQPVYFSKEHFLYKILLETYREETKDFTSKPISSGGATYARALDNCIAFGATFPNGESTEHKPNEKAKVEDLIKSIKIYAKAIYKICEEV